MLYEYLLDCNKKYGIQPIDIIHSLLGCEPEAIQNDVIIAPVWKPALFSNHTNSSIQVFDGLHKIWNLPIKNKIITYIVTGIGAPNIMEVVLALGCTPCKNIVFIGSVGGLDEKMGIGDIVIPEYLICGDGACRYLTNKRLVGNDCFGEKYYPSRELYKIIVSKTQEITKTNNVNWHIGKNYCIDTIIAQCAHIDEILDMGCNSVEMETAALFKSAEISKIKAAAIFSVSDNTILRKSLLSGRAKEEIDHRKNTRKNILTNIVINCFE